MGLFNYESSGPGISKYEPKKKGLALFFDLFYRKIWKITGLNILFFLFTIPLFLAAFVVLYFNDKENVSSMLILSVVSVLILIFALTWGPALAGMTKVMRAFLIDKHTFIIRDFFRGFRENYKKSVVVGIIDILVAVSAFAGYNMYPDWAEFYNNKIFYIFLALTISVALVVFIMNYYIFLMMNATDLSLKNLIKNSFALTFLAIKENILSTIFVFLFAVFMFLLLLNTPVIYTIITPFFPIGLVWFIICFNSYPVIQKYVINPYYESKGEINPELLGEGESIEEETLFEDMGGKEQPIEKRKKTKGKRIS